MRNLVISLCILIALPAAARGFKFPKAPHVAFGALGALMGKGALSSQHSIGIPIQASTNRSLVEVQFLAEHKMKVAKDARCDVYVDMTLAASHLSAVTLEAAAVRKEQLRKSLSDGWKAKCYVDKTPVEAMPYGLRVFWEARHGKLSPAPACAYYVGQSNTLALGPGTEDDRKYALSQLYVDASRKGCVLN